MPTLDASARADVGLASELRFGVMRLRRRLALERHPDNPLSLGSMAVLAYLVRGGDRTIGELAAFEGVQPPSMTRTVTLLEEAGYVVRRPHETDRRAVVVHVTEQGRDAVLADRERRDAWLDQRLSTLTDDERAVLRQAAALLHQIAQED